MCLVVLDAAQSRHSRARRKTSDLMPGQTNRREISRRVALPPAWEMPCKQPKTALIFVPGTKGSGVPRLKSHQRDMADPGTGMRESSTDLRLPEDESGVDGWAAARASKSTPGHNVTVLTGAERSPGKASTQPAPPKQQAARLRPKNQLDERVCLPPRWKRRTGA